MSTAIVLRQQSYSGYESLPNEGATLTDAQVDTNWIGLLQRTYDVIPVGAIIPYYSTSSPSGWLLTDGSTIGNTGSAANSANALYVRLFTLLWNECVAYPATALVAHDASSNPINFSSSPVSAATAWAGLYIIALPNLHNAFPIGLSSAGIATTLNQTGGSATVDSSHMHSNTLSLSTVANHNHGAVSGTTSAAGGFTPSGSIAMDAVADHTHIATSPPHLHIATDVAQGATDGADNTFAQHGSILIQTTTVTVTNANAGGHTPTGTFTGNAQASHTHTFSGTMADAGSHTHTISGSVSTGGSTTLSIVPPFYGLNFIIKYSWGL